MQSGCSRVLAWPSDSRWGFGVMSPGFTRLGAERRGCVVVCGIMTGGGCDAGQVRGWPSPLCFGGVSHVGHGGAAYLPDVQSPAEFPVGDSP